MERVLGELGQKGRRTNTGRLDTRRERRTVTVLFVDISGFTAMTERMDVEDLTAVLDRVFDVLSRVIMEFGGTVDKFLGDAVMGVFGAPMAHEDDAERAVRAALAMKREIAALATELGLPLRIGVGINTGPVIAGTFGTVDRSEYTVIGDSVNLASRIESLAQPGQILITQSTRDRCLGACDPIPLGEVVIRGKRLPIATYEVRELAPASRRLTHGARTSRLCGRARQVDRLTAWLGSIVEARRSEQPLAPPPPRALVFSGEVGIGKTRLAQEALVAAAGLGYRLVEAAAESFAGPGERSLVRQVGAGLLGTSGGDAAEDAAAIRRQLAGLGIESPETSARVLERWLGLAADADAPPADELAETLIEVSQAIARREPILVIADNLQWADDASLELLGRLLSSDPAHPLLLLGLGRTGAEARVQAVVGDAACETLGRLDVRRTSELAAALLGLDDLPSDLAALMAERTGGNPFFIEETVKDLIAQGVVTPGEPIPPLEDLKIPSTVQEVILARIDRLDPRSRTVLQVASVIGRTFRHDVLERVIGVEANQLDSCLTRLEEAHLIFRLSSGPRGELMFRHNVTRDVAYETILRRNRSALHARIAEVLEEVLGDEAHDQVAVLAQHYLETDRDEKKARYLLLAGDRAFKLGSLADAERYLLLADEVVPAGDAARDRVDSLLSRIYAALGRNEEVVGRLSALIERTQDAAQRHWARVERGRAYYHLGDNDRAEEDLRRVVSTERDPRAVSAAYRVLAQVRRDQGKLEAALGYSRQALELLDAAGDRALFAEALMVHADTEATAGREEDSLRTYQMARALFDELGMKEQLAAVYNNIGIRYRRRGELGVARQYYERCLEIALEVGVWRHIAVAQHNLGNLLALAGELESALESFAEAERLRERHGDRRNLAVTLLARAEVLHALGKTDEALATCARGVVLFEQLGNLRFLPQGIFEQVRLTLAAGDVAGAGALVARLTALASGQESQETRRLEHMAQGLVALACGQAAEADRAFLAANALASCSTPTQAEIAYDHATAVLTTDPARAETYLAQAESLARSPLGALGARERLREIQALRAGMAAKA